MFMDSTDRPELRLWKVLWPVSIIAGLAMVARLMHLQYIVEKGIAPESDTWVSPIYGLVSSLALLFISLVFLLSKIRPERMQRITVMATVMFVTPLVAVSYVPGLEVFIPVIVVLAVPVVRGLRLPVLVPRGKKLVTWLATISSFFAIPLLSSLLAVGELRMIQSQAGNVLYVLGLSGAMATVFAIVLIGKQWREKAWRGVLLEFVVIQMMVSLSIRTIIDATLSSA